MDLRDFALWIQEARRRRLERRAEAYNAALLPQQKAAVVKRETERIKQELYEMDNEDEIEAMEKIAQGRLLKVKEKMAQRKRKRPKVKRG